MSKSEIAHGYTRKIGLLKAGLKSEKFECVSIGDVTEESYAAFHAGVETQGYTSRELIDYTHDLERRDGRMFNFFVKKIGDPEYLASASIMMLPGRKTATIGLHVKEDKRGQGLGTEITKFLCEGLAQKANQLGIRQITAEVYLQSERTEGILLRAGFSRVGIAPTTYTTNTDGSEMEITGKNVVHYRYGLEKTRTR